MFVGWLSNRNTRCTKVLETPLFRKSLVYILESFIESSVGSCISRSSGARTPKNIYTHVLYHVVPEGEKAVFEFSDIRIPRLFSIVLLAGKTRVLFGA